MWQGKWDERDRMRRGQVMPRQHLGRLGKGKVAKIMHSKKVTVVTESIRCRRQGADRGEETEGGGMW